MTTPLFTTYSQRENRVTATFIAVLERISVLNMSRILGALLSESAEDFSLLTFRNQPKGVVSIPDAKIETGHSVWFETKIERDAVHLEQIKNHMKSVGDNEKLIVLTPDDEKPAVLDNSKLCKEYMERIVWANFNLLDDIIADILDDKEAPPSEFEAFLLREIRTLIQQEELITIPATGRVIVVSGGFAWYRYNEKSVYGDIRKPNWKPSDHLAFYTGNEIKQIVPRIKSTVSPINITNKEEVKEKLDARQKQIVNDLKANPVNNETFDASLRMLFLSKPCDEETIDLKKPIENDKIGKNGKRVAWMYGGVRYVTLDSLTNARYTSELEQC